MQYSTTGSCAIHWSAANIPGQNCDAATLLLPNQGLSLYSWHIQAQWKPLSSPFMVLHHRLHAADALSTDSFVQTSHLLQIYSIPPTPSLISWAMLPKKSSIDPVGITSTRMRSPLQWQSMAAPSPWTRPPCYHTAECVPAMEPGSAARSSLQSATTS